MPLRQVHGAGFQFHLHLTGRMKYMERAGSPRRASTSPGRAVCEDSSCRMSPMPAASISANSGNPRHHPPAHHEIAPPDDIGERRGK